MNLSGIVVSAQPGRFDDAVDRISGLPGVEIHYQDPATARLVVVQEAESIDAEVEGLKLIKSVPGVVVAELVYHYFAEDESITVPPSTEPGIAGGISDSVLRRLNPS